MIYIIIGHYGSGKTEIAINLAQSLKNPILVDMDVVNPYFRTKDAEEKLQAEGIQLISPEFANTNVDVPSLPPDILGALQSDRDVILDVGGDDDGAIVLGQYNKYITAKPYEVIFVLNTKRPCTETTVDILEMIADIETTSRLKVSSIINNTNIRNETTPELVMESFALAEEVANSAGLPIKAVAARNDILAQIDTDLPKMGLDLNLILPWEV